MDLEKANCHVKISQVTPLSIDKDSVLAFGRRVDGRFGRMDDVRGAVVELPLLGSEFHMVALLCSASLPCIRFEELQSGNLPVDYQVRIISHLGIFYRVGSSSKSAWFDWRIPTTKLRSPKANKQIMLQVKKRHLKKQQGTHPANLFANTY